MRLLNIIEVNVFEMMPVCEIFLLSPSIVWEQALRRQVVGARFSQNCKTGRTEGVGHICKRRARVLRWIKGKTEEI